LDKKDIENYRPIANLCSPSIFLTILRGYSKYKQTMTVTSPESTSMDSNKNWALPP
jgi:hypothetical protein